MDLKQDHKQLTDLLGQLHAEQERGFYNMM